MSINLYNSKVPITIQASDDVSGVDRIEYKVDATGWKIIPLTDAANGKYSTFWEAESKTVPREILFRTTDRSGNTILDSVMVNFRPEAAPTAPSLSSPANGSDVEVFTPALIVNNASDPNDDQLTYEFEVYADQGLAQPVAISRGIPSRTGSTSWRIPIELNENTRYFWRARAFDGQLYGGWMTTASFRVNSINDPPTAPTPATPVNGGVVATLTPILTVNNASDPDSSGLTYNFDVALDAGFTQIVASVQGIFSGQGTTSFQIPVTLQENQQYYWRAQADDWLSEGPWMTPATFSVRTANVPPSVPTIIAPPDGAYVTTLSPEIAVANSTDPDSPVLSYLFELDTAPTFDTTSLIRSANVQAGEGMTIWNVVGLKENTRYYIRTKSSDSLTESPWSPVSSFFVSIVNDPPTAPVLANPSNDAGVNVFKPVFSVQNATDPDYDPLTYDFEIYDDSALANLVFSANSIPETSLLTSWTVPSALEEDRTYFWRARAFDGKLYSSWTVPASFKVNTADNPPSAPTLAQPAVGSSLATLYPTLAVFNALDSDSQNLTYDYEIYSSNALVSSLANIPEDGTGITTVTLSDPLTDNSAYQWRCRAYDGNSFGPWMNMAIFSTHVQQTSINAEIVIEPKMLNKTAEGTWVMAKIVLPQAYSPYDVDITSIRLEGVVYAETKPYTIDREEGGRSVLKVKFKRSEILALLPTEENIIVHLTGKVGNLPFEGVDSVRVIH